MSPNLADPPELARSPAGDGPPAHVLVWIQATPNGHAALARAKELASASGARLTVVSVATHERVRVGCAPCRQGAAIWNHEMTEIGHEELHEAASMLTEAAPAEYRLAFGSPPAAITATAARGDADVIVLPSQRRGLLLQRRARRLEQKLAENGTWRVVTAAAADASENPARRRDTNR